ncbi:MAG: RsmE family RNA methyltransferase [Candidatus Poribacteria bacterium]|nr:RsmE family RNA methyltransferase [Candidatus Poribacteria bacterium]
MYSCYAAPARISTDAIHIDDAERHHLLNVLRLKAGDSVRVFDGEGNSYTAILRDTHLPALYATIIKHQFHPHTPPHITLFQGLPKSDKMDLVVQKTTEIGVDGIVPTICHRSIPKRSEAAQGKLQARWQRIANETAKQCRRSRLAKVHEAKEIERCFAQATQFDLSILLWENEEEREIKEVLRRHKGAASVGLYVGPEGGFSAEETETAIQSGLQPASLCPNILRTETAGIVGAAIVMYELREV